MILESKHKKTLEKILNSSEFSTSKLYQTYLAYLVNAAEQGQSPKETTIAIEVFGKDASFNPAEDTIVRSHTYTLRKKLESYYYKEGKEDKYRLKIPKGHYKVEFAPVSEDDGLPDNRIRLLARSAGMLILIVLCALLAVLWIHNRALESDLNRYRIIDLNDPIWKEYLQSDLPILIVAGNHFFFNEYDDRYQQIVSIRHPKINDIEDFQVLYPGETVTPSPEPYFPYHSIWSLPPILCMLYSVNKTPILRKSSDISPQILKEYNIIFEGSIKTLYALKHTLLKSHFQFEILPHRIIYTPPEGDPAQVFETTLHSEGPNEDLVLALKLPGPSNNAIFIIASYHSLGAPEIANYLINARLRSDLENQFMERYNRIPDYFEILFRVSGIDKTAYNTEILVFNEIPGDVAGLFP